MIEAEPESDTPSDTKPIAIDSSSPTAAMSVDFIKEEDDDSEYEDIGTDDEDENGQEETPQPKAKKNDEEVNEPSVPRSMCLRCSKRLRTDPTLRCTRPTATAKCRRCSSMNKKCDTVPELFASTLHEVQRLGLSLHRKEIQKPAFTKAASNYVSNVEAYARKSQKKTPARRAQGEASEDNSVVTQLAKIDWRLEQLVRIGAAMAKIDVPKKEDEPATFHAGEIVDG